MKAFLMKAFLAIILAVAVSAGTVQAKHSGQGKHGKKGKHAKHGEYHGGQKGAEIQPRQNRNIS
jgi:hypothetical protein